MTKLDFPATSRNRDAILDVLRRVFPARGRVLEIASGSGQHAVHFARHLPELVFSPTDVAEENLASIRAYVEESGLPNLLPPARLDVLDDEPALDAFDAIFNANMIHIAPIECTHGLFRVVARALVRHGVFVLYGPFRVGGAHTSESNASFDASLRSRDPRWGVRDLEVVVAVAETHGLGLEERVPMPANNQSLVFRLTAGASSRSESSRADDRSPPSG